MFSRLFIILSLLILSNCSSFKSQSLVGKKIETLLSSLKATGEGRGRLGIASQKYVFSYDALLNEHFDWILAASIPLHGEEILTLPALNQNKISESKADAFGSRIEQAIAEYLRSQEESHELTKKFLQEFRSIMRLVLHKELKLGINCEQDLNSKGYLCKIDDSKYHVISDEKRLLIKNTISSLHQIELIAENLTDSFFSKTSINLYSQKAGLGPELIVSLELFWK